MLGMIRGVGVCTRKATSTFISKLCHKSETSTWIRSVPVRRISGDSKLISTNERWKMVYEGPLSRTVRLVKTFSLTTAVASLVGSPVIMFFGKQSVPFVGKLAIATVMCFAGCGTTVLLHMITKSYIHKLYFDPDEKLFAAETLNLFSKRARTEFSVEDITIHQADKAFSTFEVKGRNYFLHQELLEAQQVLQYVHEWKKATVDVTSNA